MPPAGDRSAVSGIALSGVSGRRWISHPPASALSALLKSPGRARPRTCPCRSTRGATVCHPPPSSLPPGNDNPIQHNTKEAKLKPSHGVCAVVMWPTVEHPVIRVSYRAARPTCTRVCSRVRQCAPSVQARCAGATADTGPRQPTPTRVRSVPSGHEKGVRRLNRLSPLFSSPDTLYIVYAPTLSRGYIYMI